MDPVTHTLTGALIGQAGLKRKTGLATPALLVGANLPDIDVACFLWLDGVEHLAFRRGITHGPIAWVLLPLLLAGVLWWFDRSQAKRGTRPEGRLPVHFGWLYGLSFLACLTHPALDWLNVYGIRLLEPFSSRWFYGDVLFIVDVWLWAIMGTGLWLSLRRERIDFDWRTPAQITIGLSLAYVGLNAAITGVTETIAGTSGETVIASPPPLAFWRRGMIKGEVGDWYVRDNDGAFPPYSAVTGNICVWADLDQRGFADPKFRAFLFWSRAPFAERAPDGSVLIRDARYYDPRARNRFTVALPHVRCEPVR